ncbi:MAG: sodium:solute symporter family protein, partial [Halobacteriovoraceae bacterium]|nr:sodium:solute symporter family protein [Halobacteriovoraceae bacterium]
LQLKLEPKYFSPTSDEGYLQLFVWGFIALSTLVDPNFYQRCFAAESPKVAKKGILISTVIWVCFDLCTTFGAMYAKAHLPDAAAGEAYLLYSVKILPMGLKGFFLAGILATILSTLDSYLFLAGSTLTYDLSSENQQNNPIYHSSGILFVGILSFGMAKFFDGNIKLVWKTLGSYSAGCILFPLLWGHISQRRLTDHQFVASCLISAFTMTLWKFVLMKNLSLSVDPLYIGVLTSFVCLFTGQIWQKIQEK